MEMFIVGPDEGEGQRKFGVSCLNFESGADSAEVGEEDVYSLNLFFVRYLNIQGVRR